MQISTIRAEMTTPKIRKYNSISLRQVIAELEGWIEQTEDSLDTAESADSPNDERIDMLQDRIDNLQAAVDALSAI